MTAGGSLPRWPGRAAPCSRSFLAHTPPPFAPTDSRVLNTGDGASRETKEIHDWVTSSVADALKHRYITKASPLRRVYRGLWRKP